MASLYGFRACGEAGGAGKGQMVRRSPSTNAPAALAGKIGTCQRLLVSLAELLLRAALAERA